MIQIVVAVGLVLIALATCYGASHDPANIDKWLGVTGMVLTGVFGWMARWPTSNGNGAK